MLEIFLYLLIGLFVVRFMIWPLMLHLSPSLRTTVAYQDWTRSVAARGIGPDEASAELAARFTLGRVRRMASDRVLVEPTRADEIIRELLVDEAGKMEIVRGRFEAYQWLKTTSALKWTDILYPDALAAAMAALPPITIVRDPVAESDFLAALTIQR